jgi:dUTPase
MPIRLYIDNDYTDNIITNILNRQKRTLIISSTKDKITKLANKTYEHIERDLIKNTRR